MKRNITQTIGKLLLGLAAVALTTSVFASEAKESMCVKQKDGTYKCKASDKTMKEPCCETPANDEASPKPKK